ncbi:Strictosidine synthase family protein [Brugia malayi]|uniref:Strictosidine synthase family protein n=2 Tax=Brugia malayi TaxID=6279 RepID=A0A4E9G1A5_BRUMA|nr:Strictosidine synthase family protein [Brugia malayi]VIO99096.1 Strictosidine synthase family protein [Brugia malayi]
MNRYFILAFLVAIVAIITFIVTPSSVFQCEHYKLPKPPKLEGILAVNNILTKAEYLLKDKIFGPESIIVEKDKIVTGMQNGMIISAESGVIRKSLTFGSVNLDLCDGRFDMEPKCGRPLGLRRLNAETILAIDTYFGIFSVNFEKGQHMVILGNQTEVNGKPMKFLNDIDVVDRDVLIFTDSSSKWDRRHFMNILLEGIPNGRVLRLTRSTGKIEVIMDKLYFPNGIQLFPDKQSFLVSETGAARIKRHWIAGPRMGETEIFIDNLPGLPDNIRLGSNGTFWIGLGAVRHSDQFSMLDFLADKPYIRKCILQLVPERQWEWLMSIFGTKHALILQLNEKGQIVASAHDPMGQIIKEVSQVTEANEYLYLGSYRSPFIARLRKDHIIY